MTCIFWGYKGVNYCILAMCKHHQCTTLCGKLWHNKTIIPSYLTQLLTCLLNFRAKHD